MRELLRGIIVSLLLSFVLAVAVGRNSHDGGNFVASHLPYQAHSFNDLAIARHHMLKGVKYFKFDVSLADKPSCQKYSNWDGKSSCFNSQYFSEEVCCLAMRGDAGSENNFNYQFSTSEDFIALLEEFLGKYSKSIDILFAAINFQFTWELNNPIAERFLYQLALLLKKYPVLTLAFGEDFIFEYDRICQHVTGKSGASIEEAACTAERKVISDSPFVLQSGAMHPFDPRDHKSRYRNFNIYYLEIDRLCREGFPTWPNKYPMYPLIFWEPSNEDQIQSSLRKLLSPSCVKLHNRTIQGIAFASNIDPEMFEIYMKQTNLNEISTQFPWNYNSKKLWLDNTLSMKLATLVGVYSSNSNSNERLVAYWQRKDGDIGATQHLLSLFSFDDQKNVINLEKTVQIDSEVQELHTIGSTLYAVIKSDDSTTREYNAKIVSFNSKLEQIKSRDIPSYLISYASDSSIYYIARTSNPNYFNLYVLSPDLTNSTQYGVSTYMPKSQLDSVSAIYFKKAEKADDDVFLVFGDDVDRTWMAQIKYGNIHREKTLTYGTNANVIDGEDGTIIISLENSYSAGGILLNNNAENKCQLHKKEASERLAHLPNLINTLEGSFDDLMGYFNEESEEIITACYPKLVFSKHMNGAKAEIATAWNQLFISTKYVPLNQQDLMMALFSGGSNYQPSLRTKTGFLLASLNANRRFTSLPSSPNIFAQQ